MIEQRERKKQEPPSWEAAYILKVLFKKKKSTKKEFLLKKTAPFQFEKEHLFLNRAIFSRALLQRRADAATLSRLPQAFTL